MNSSLSLTADPIPQLLWRIGIPASVGMFFNTMYHFVDTYCAGLLSTDALAAMSLSFPVVFLVFAVGSGLAQGTVALLGSALGSGNRADARHLFGQALVLAMFAGIVMTLLGLLATPWLFRRFGATGGYLDAAVAFIYVQLAGAVFFILPMTINAALSAQGETRIYRNFLIAGFCANCLLNPLLMWGGLGLPPLGIAGISLATVLIQIGGTFWLWRHASESELGRGFTWSLLYPHASSIRRILAQALPAVLNMLTIALGIFVVTGFVQGFGKEAVAALGIATRIEQSVLMPAIGLSSALLSIVAHNHGAGLRSRIRQAWVTSLRFGVVVMLLGGALLWLFRGTAMRLFTSDAGVISKGSDYLSVAALTLGAYPILFATVFLMQGLKRPGYGFWIGLYRQGVAPLLVIPVLALTLGWGLWGVWLSVCLVNWSAALFGLFWGWRELSKLNDLRTIHQSI